MLHTLDDYRLAALALLPRGRAFALRVDSATSDFLEGCMAEFARLDQALHDLALSALPGDAVAYLSDWEEVLGLPRAVPLEPLSVAVRQYIATDWLLGEHGNALADYQRRLDTMDLFIEAVHYYAPFETTSACNVQVYGEEWMHAVMLDVSGAGAAPGPIDTKALTWAQQMIDDQLRRAHTSVRLNPVAPSSSSGGHYARSWLGTYATTNTGEVATYG